MKIVGILIILFGVVDLAGSFVGFDLWGGIIGINLPDLLWTYSAYIEIALGFVVMNYLGSNSDEKAAAD